MATTWLAFIQIDSFNFHLNDFVTQAKKKSETKTKQGKNRLLSMEAKKIRRKAE